MRICISFGASGLQPLSEANFSLSFPGGLFVVAGRGSECSEQAVSALQRSPSCSAVLLAALLHDEMENETPISPSEISSRKEMGGE